MEYTTLLKNENKAAVDMAAYPCQPHALARSELDWYGFSACAEAVHPLHATAYSPGTYPATSSSLAAETDCL